MALLKILFGVEGGTPVELTATPLDPLPLVLTDLTPGTVRFNVTNPLSRDVSFSTVTVELTGPAAAKATAEVDEPTPIVIAAGATAEISVTVAPTLPIFEGETLSVAVTVKE